MQGVNLKENDFVERIFVASTHEFVLFFSTKGKVYRLKVHELPLASRTARGTAIVNLLPLEEGEKISAVIDTRDFPEDDFLMFATRSGMVKKTAMSEYSRSRRDGIIAINLRDDDELIAVRRVHVGDKVILVSDAGKAIKWDESQVRPMGRNTTGVKGITLTDGANLLGMEISNDKGDLFVITEKGYGKRTPVADYPEQNRGGQGVYTIQMTIKKGLLAGLKVVAPQHELMIISTAVSYTHLRIYGELGAGEEAQMGYESLWFTGREPGENPGRAEVEEQLRSALERVRAEEARRCQTLAGPHLDDVAFSIAGLPARNFGSQGQQRSLVLAVKLAQVEVVHEMQDVYKRQRQRSVNEIPAKRR